MTGQKQGYGLQIIFSIFLGLMVAAFVGVGVYTFYPRPGAEIQKQIQELNRKMEQVNIKDPSMADDETKAEFAKIQAEQNRLQDKITEVDRPWGRNTSIILIAFATLAMSISLIRADQLPVISNGLLLGGVFTMIYGVGWIIATDTSVARFIVMTVALIITIGLGYLRFVRGREVAPAAAATAATGSAAELAPEIAQRLAALERRMDAAAAALGEPGRYAE